MKLISVWRSCIKRFSLIGIGTRIYGYPVQYTVVSGKAFIEFGVFMIASVDS